MITLGVERERFITDKIGRIVPAIGVLLPLVKKMSEEKGIKPELFGYELFAGQIEDRTPACASFCALRLALEKNDHILNKAAKYLGLGFNYSEFVDEAHLGKLEVNPFDKRHQKIWRNITLERRVAASQVAAVHIHLSTTIDQAIKLLNICCDGVVTRLSKMGDHSSGKRLAAYKVMTGCDSISPQFREPEDLLKYIESYGGEKNVWDFVRYKPSTKTTEFRMFGSTANVLEVLDYAKACFALLESIS